MNNIQELMVLLADDICYECNSDTFNFQLYQGTQPFSNGRFRKSSEVYISKICSDCETEDSFILRFAENEDGPMIGVYGLLNVIDGDRSILEKFVDVTTPIDQDSLA